MVDIKMKFINNMSMDSQVHSLKLHLCAPIKSLEHMLFAKPNEYIASFCTGNIEVHSSTGSSDRKNAFGSTLSSSISTSSSSTVPDDLRGEFLSFCSLIQLYWSLPITFPVSYGPIFLPANASSLSSILLMCLQPSSIKHPADCLQTTQRVHLSTVP